MAERINEREVEKAGLDPKAVQKVAGIAAKLLREAKKLGIQVFAGCSLQLRYDDKTGTSNFLVLWSKNGFVDGGDGGSSYDKEGLERGE